MLIGVPSILTPDLLKTLMEMGHSDEIVIADGNFPSGTFGKKVIRLDGHGVPEVLDAILKFFPLDPYVEKPVALMEVVRGDAVEPPIWEVFKGIFSKHEPINNKIGNIERFAFYERAKSAYAVIATSEAALYANIILIKGVVIE